jgi:photosystem II stability/assembly factor-like uncharacterized protein
MNLRRHAQGLSISLLLGVSSTVTAAKTGPNPVFLITPQSTPEITIYSNETKALSYLIQNNPKNPYTLNNAAVVNLPHGVTWVPGGTCSLPTFTLASGASCTATLQISGSQLTHNVHGGPHVAATIEHQVYKSQPSAANQLNITLMKGNAPSYTGIYVQTSSSSINYSPNNGVDWGVMLSPQAWFQYVSSAMAVTSDGTMYMASGITGYGNPGSGAITLIYSTDGVTWNQVNNALPIDGDNDWVQSLFAIGTTVYVGTGEGYVYSTNDHGSTWSSSSNTPPDGSAVKAIVVDASGIYYAGTQNGNIYYSMDSGISWTALTNQPAGGGAISSLAIDSAGTLYAVTSNTTSQPQYNSAPRQSSAWQSMLALSPADGNITAIAAAGTTIYVGTDADYVAYTTDKGANWHENLLSLDTYISGIISLCLSQSNSPSSSLFVESYSTIQINNGQNTTSTLTVNNFSNNAAINVKANPSQLPPGITSNSCASVAPGGSCALTLTATNARAFAPITFDIIDGANNILSRSALVSSITPNGGTDYYYVYNVNNNTAYVVDNTDMGSNIIWSSNGNSGQVDYASIYGIDETSTTVSPSPSSGSVAGQSACNGATDGFCNSGNILAYYSSVNDNYYAAGLCGQSTNGGASAGDWALPSMCEFSGGIYNDHITNNFVSCSPVLTGIAALNSLGGLISGDLQAIAQDLQNANAYWSSTEYSSDPQTTAAIVVFNPADGLVNGAASTKDLQYQIRCVRGVSM